MFKFRRTYIYTTCALLLCLFKLAYGFKVVLHPKCPGNDSKISWRDYMSGKIPWVPQKRSAIAGVQFTTAKKVNDPDAIGHLRTDRCYGVAFNKTSVGNAYPKGFQSWRNDPNAKGSNMKTKLPGDPEKYEINVFGVILQYEESGDVIDRRGRVVGRLVCYLSDECGRY